MTTEQLELALRLATDPPGGVGLDALRELAREDRESSWGVTAVAQHLGVSAHTLRYYERAGLVRVGRDPAGRRVYSPAAVRRLVFITRMRASGMTIARLKRYIDLVEAGPGTVAARLGLLTEHRDALRDQITQLQLALAVTEYKLATYTEGPRP